VRSGDGEAERQGWEVGGVAGAAAAADRGGGGGGRSVGEEECIGAGRKNAEPCHALPQRAAGHGLTPSN